MPRRHVERACLAALLCLGADWGLASESARSPESLVMDAAHAASSLTYQGVVVASEGATMRTFRIFHRQHEGREQQRVVALDGEFMETIRDGERFACVLPDGSRTESRQHEAQFASSVRLTTALMPSMAQYELSAMAEGRVAGRATIKVALMPKDDHRYGQWLWLDEQTQLPLKTATIDAMGSVLEQMHFTELRVGEPIASADLRLDVLAQSAAPVNPAAHVGELKPGFRLAWVPDGFIARGTSSLPDAEAMTLSDGVASISVFVDEDSGPVREPVSARRGATSVYQRWASHYRVTLIGEVPAATLARMAAAIDRP